VVQPPQNPPYDPQASVLNTALSGDAPAMQVWRQYQAALAESGRSSDSANQPNLALLSQQMDALNAWSLESEAHSILGRLGITVLDWPMGRLSGGQRKRVALAAALLNPADLLILDEPTNHLDNQAIDWLENYMQKFTGALLMVTHDRYFLERVTKRILEVDGARLYSYPGSYSIYLERKLEREELEMAAASKKKALLRKELAWIRRGARARSTKQKARIERFDQLKADQTHTGAPPVQMTSAASRLGKKIIVLTNISHSFGTQTIVANYSCIIGKDERLGVVGPNGIGKSTLLHLINGQLQPDQGKVEIGSTVKIGYFPQESRDLPEEMRVIDYIREAGEYLSNGQKTLSAAQMLETFLFTPAAQWTTLQKLSGGEKRRLHLLRILMGAPNVLLLDEPGNDLDVETLTILEDYLDSFPGAVIAVSHDRYFLDRTAKKILAFEGQGQLNEYTGNYTDYLAHAAAQPEAGNMAQASENPVNDTVKREKAKPLKFTYNEKREFEEIDDKIAEAEQELKDLNARIEEAASDYLLLQRLAAQREQTEQRLDMLLERWTYLNELAEQIAQQKK
jgi:ATP-binding cassette subfamily F protein uup